MQLSDGQLLRRVKLGAVFMLVIFGVQLVGRFPEFWPLTRWGMYTRIGPPPATYSTYAVEANSPDGTGHILYTSDLGIKAGELIYYAFRGDDDERNTYRVSLAERVERTLNNPNISMLTAWQTTWQIDAWAVPPYQVDEPAERALLGSFPLDYYQRTGLDDQTIDLQFGDHFGLLDFALIGPAQVAQCGILYVHSSWQALTTPPADYQITVVLADENGMGRAQHDGPLAGALTSTWQTGAAHLSRSAIEIPCDLPTGSYNLLTGLYDPETVRNLAVTYPDGTPYGSLAYLTTIDIVEGTLQ